MFRLIKEVLPINKGEDLDINMFWGKSDPEKSLIEHMIDAASASNVLLNGLFYPIKDTLSQYLKIEGDVVVEIVSYVTGLHDIGKCYPDFQAQGVIINGKTGAIEYETKAYKFMREKGWLSSSRVDLDGFRHENYTEKILIDIFKKMNRATDESIDCVCTILKNHHQHQGGHSRRSPKRVSPWWESRQEEIEAAMYGLYKPDFIDFQVGIVDERRVDAICMLVLGIVVISDWVASGKWFENIAGGNDLSAYKESSLNVASEAVKKCGLTPQGIINTDGGFTNMWEYLSDNQLRPVQKSVQEIFKETTGFEPMLAIIEAPMGEGKTEAGSYMAAKMEKMFGKNGIYFALPTAATSNQMYGRISEMLDKNGIGKSRLLHSTAWMQDDKSSITLNTDDVDSSSLWLAPLRRGMLESYAVGTVDQAMFAVLQIRFGVLRLVGLANKVLVIDEIHSYDAYMSTIINTLLRWCKAMSIPVVLLSATLTQEKRNEMLNAYGGTETKSNAYPLITMVDKYGETRECEVSGTFMKSEVELSISKTLGKWDDVAKMAIDKVSDGGCLSIIVNTVKEAQSLYEEIDKRVGESFHTMLFHAQFRIKDRNRIESECLRLYGKDEYGGYLNRPQKSILVATQVVEQSLDIDFDEEITAICPIDLMLQRIGRLHRHNDIKRPATMKSAKVTVLMPKNKDNFGSSEWVYAPIYLTRTMEKISNLNKISLPLDIRRLVEDVYSSEVDENEMANWIKNAFKNDILSDSAIACAIPRPSNKTFFMDQLNMHGFADDNDDNNRATTRAGEPSIRLALIPENEYDELVTANNHNEWDKDVAQRIMGYTALFPIRKVPLPLMPADGFAAPIEGRGRLRGIWLLKLIDDVFYINDKKIIGYRCDEKLGVMVERRGVNGKI